MDHTHTPFRSAWCDLLQRYLDRAHMDGADLATRLKTTQQSVSAYRLGRTKPPLDQLPQMARILGLIGREREEFVWLAHEQYTPKPVWDRLVSLERSATRGERELADARSQVADLSAQLAGLMAQVASLKAKVMGTADDAVEATGKVVGSTGDVQPVAGQVGAADPHR